MNAQSNAKPISIDYDFFNVTIKIDPLTNLIKQIQYGLNGKAMRDLPEGTKSIDSSKLK